MAGGSWRSCGALKYMEGLLCSRREEIPLLIMMLSIHYSPSTLFFQEEIT